MSPEDVTGRGHYLSKLAALTAAAEHLVMDRVAHSRGAVTGLVEDGGDSAVTGIFFK